MLLTTVTKSSQILQSLPEELVLSDFWGSGQPGDESFGRVFEDAVDQLPFPARDDDEAFSGVDDGVGDEGGFQQQGFGKVKAGGQFAADIAGDDGIDDHAAGKEELAESGEVLGEGGFGAAIDEIAFSPADAGQGGEADDPFEMIIALVHDNAIQDRDRAGI